MTEKVIGKSTMQAFIFQPGSLISAIMALCACAPTVSHPDIPGKYVDAVTRVRIVDARLLRMESDLRLVEGILRRLLYETEINRTDIMDMKEIAVRYQRFMKRSELAIVKISVLTAYTERRFAEHDRRIRALEEEVRVIRRQLGNLTNRVARNEAAIAALEGREKSNRRLYYRALRRYKIRVKAQFRNVASVLKYVLRREINASRRANS